MITIILDRDGVVLEERGEYTFKIADSKVLTDNIEALKKYSNSLQEKYQFFILTNQGGIAKGLYTIAEVDAIHNLIQNEFVKRGLCIVDYYVCPHHNDFGKCLCRKPKSGLYEKIVAKYSLSPNECIMIGDKERDIIPAKALGMHTVLIESNALLNENSWPIL